MRARRMRRARFATDRQTIGFLRDAGLQSTESLSAASRDGFTAVQNTESDPSLVPIACSRPRFRQAFLWT
jgi:hypothetical protein